jgi:hypothetical protein
VSSVVAIHSPAGRELLVEARRLNLLAADEPWTLVVWADQVIPEVGDGFEAQLESLGAARVVDLNALLAPFHPADWDPSDVEITAWRRVLADNLAPVSGLVVEDVDHPIGRTLAKLIPHASLSALDPGLSAYGPPARRRSPAFEQRIVARWYTDWVPGLSPVGSAPSVPLAVPPLPESSASVPLVISSDLVGTGLAGPSVEVALHARMFAAAARVGGVVRFLPDPGTSPAQRWLIERAAGEAGLELEVIGSSLADIGGRPSVAYGIASPLLPWLHGQGVRVHAVGTAELLGRLAPYHHPARAGLTLIDALLREDGRAVDVAGAQELLAAVSYVMRPEYLPHSHQPTAVFLATMPVSDQRRYFSRRRLEALGLARRRSLWDRALAKLPRPRPHPRPSAP